MKWGGAVVTVLLLVVWVGSGWWSAVAYRAYDFVGSVSGGRIAFSYWGPHPVPWKELKLASGLNRQPVPFEWWFEWTSDKSLGPPLTRLTVAVPIWSLVLLVGGLTTWLWRCDRRHVPGFCAKCGYDLRGTDHAACPECGAPPPALLRNAEGGSVMRREAGRAGAG